jgi:hypothetical protein
MADEITRVEKEVVKDTKKFLKTYWAVATVVLAIILIAVLIYSQTGKVSANAAAQKVVNLANSQGANATLLSVSNSGSFYEVVVEIQGQQIPVYVTKDGKYLVTNPIPMDAPSSNNQQTTATPDTVSKTDKPVVQLYVMSHCPYGVEAQKIFMPVLQLLGNKADIKLHFVDYAMHGKQEIDDNNIEYCLQKEQPKGFIDFMSCFVNSEDSASCLASTTGIDKTKLNSCISALDSDYNITKLYSDKSTWLSGQYPQYPVEAALNNQFQVQGSETFIVNGVHISPQNYRWDANKMKQIICDAFTAPPAECSQTISGTSTAGPVAGGCS